MSLEEQSNETLSERCEVCGAKLTSSELQSALEAGGPALCSVHADEVVPIDEDAAGFDG